MLKYIVLDLANALRYLPAGLVTGLLAAALLSCVNERRKQGGKGEIPILFTTLFSIYMTVFLSLTFLSREQGSADRVDLELFSTWGINTRNNAYVIENILLFLPFGVLCPGVFPHTGKWYCILLLGLAVTFGVELLQLLTGRGFFQADDILSNTLGALLGYLGYRIMAHVLK